MKKYTDLVKTLLATVAILVVCMPQAQAMSWEESSDSQRIIIVSPKPEKSGFPGANEKNEHEFKFDRQSLRPVEKEHHEERQVRDDSQVPVVPEPETYAMMLAGLGLLVITMSRQKKNNFK